MKWRFFKKDEKRNKFTISGQLWDGRVVQLPGGPDKEVTEHLIRCIASLSRSKKLGELPDESLADWINGLPEKEAQRYVDLELLPCRVLDKRRPIDDLLTEFLTYSKNNCEDCSLMPKRKVAMIRRIVTAIGPDTTFEKLTQDEVNGALKKFTAQGERRKGQPISQKTRREYVFAMKSFCEWMVDFRGASSNPLRKMKAPPAKAAPVRNRRPLEVSDFSKLMDYLWANKSKYPQQKFAWTAQDRLMIYWMAVMTGFRAGELRSLTRAHVNLESHPARVTVEGWVAKNGQKATIPIGNDIATALRSYCAHHHPKAPLLRMPNELGQLTAAFYRDMDAAGVPRSFDDGTMVDFHALRSTAICWWLKHNKLMLLDVQYRARLKTLSLVQEYVDNYVPNYEELIKDTPRVIDPGLPFRQAM